MAVLRIVGLSLWWTAQQISWSGPTAARRTAHPHHPKVISTLDSELRIDYRLRAITIRLIVLFLAYTDRFFHLDDALIYARYVGNALQGHGLVYNVGERVNALTSILDAWLLLGLSWVLHGKVLLAQKIIGASCLVASALVAEAIVPLAGIFIAASSFSTSASAGRRPFSFCSWCLA
jgi:hypothetical protein